MSDYHTVTIVICDDEGYMREFHKEAVDIGSEQTGLSIDVMSFEDGTGALEFIRERQNTDRLILITDGDMEPMSGWDLCDNLIKEGLLPECSVACSNISLSGFKMLAPSGAKGSMYFVPKDRRWDVIDCMIDFLPLVSRGEPIPDPPHCSVKHDESALINQGALPPEL